MTSQNKPSYLKKDLLGQFEKSRQRAKHDPARDNPNLEPLGHGFFAEFAQANSHTHNENKGVKWVKYIIGPNGGQWSGNAQLTEEGNADKLRDQIQALKDSDRPQDLKDKYVSVYETALEKLEKKNAKPQAKIGAMEMQA